MKSTPTTKTASVTKKSGKSCVKKAGSHKREDNSSYGDSLVGKKGNPRTGKRKRSNADGFDVEGTETSDNSVGVYLKEIGAFKLLSKDQEVTFGRHIRAWFGALLSHLGRSGFVMEVLLHRAEEEMSYKATKPEKRAELGLHSEVCVAALEHARDVFVRSGCLSPAEEASLRSVFLELIEKLDLWQSIGFELLNLLEEALSIVKHQAVGSGVHPQKHAAGVAFHAANLMSETDCEVFLKKARRLKARAVAARNRLIVPNLRLVVSVALKVQRNMLPLNELIQEGNVGLMLAAERFDHRLDFRFSTFAVNLIKARMHRENDNQGRTIRVPVHQAAEIRRLDKVRAELERGLGRAVSAAELVLETGLKSYELEELSALKAGVVSLHQSKSNDGKTPLEEFVPDPDTVTPFYSKVDLTGKLDVYLMNLEETEREVVCLLYGLGGKPCLGAEETSKFLGLGQAELGRVRKRALEAMRGEIASIGEFYAYACAA